MRFLPWRTLSLVIDGADLASVGVSGSPLGTSATRGPVLRDFLKLPSDEVRRALGSAGGGQGRIVLTVPAAWCSVRPIALRCEQWLSARTEVMRSLSSLFPLAPAEATVGLIDRSVGTAGATGSATGAGAYLVAIDQTRLDPWLSALRNALGREVNDVLTPHMALLGMGLQSEERSEVLEQQPGGALVSHRLTRGQVTELCRPFDDSDASISTRRLHFLPAASGGSGEPDSSRVASLRSVGIESHDLAIAAALAPHVAPRAYVPLVGKMPTGAVRWALPAAAIALALLAMWGAGRTAESRYAAAADRIERDQAEREQALAEVEKDRERALQLVRLLEAAARGPVAGSRSVLPDLAAAHAALPPDSFLYRVELDGAGVALRGESKRASDVLQRLGDTPGFKGARNVSTPAPVEERSSEMFDIRADRAPNTTAGVAK